MTKCQKDPTCGIFLKRGLFKDIKNDIQMCKRRNTKIQLHKYTNTQIQHMTKCQIDPTCGIFFKRGLFNDIKNDIPMCQTHKYKNTNTKYTNTAYNEVPERPNMWYILEKRILQGCQKLYFYVPNVSLQKYKYKIHKFTNTAYDKVPKRPNMWQIFERGLFKGIKNYIPIHYKLEHLSFAELYEVLLSNGHWKILTRAYHFKKNHYKISNYV